MHIQLVKREVSFKLLLFTLLFQERVTADIHRFVWRLIFSFNLHNLLPLQIIYFRLKHRRKIEKNDKISISNLIIHSESLPEGKWEVLKRRAEFAIPVPVPVDFETPPERSGVRLLTEVTSLSSRVWQKQTVTVLYASGLKLTAGMSYSEWT